MLKWPFNDISWISELKMGHIYRYLAQGSDNDFIGIRVKFRARIILEKIVYFRFFSLFLNLFSKFKLTQFVLFFIIYNNIYSIFDNNQIVFKNNFLVISFQIFF